MPPFLFRFPGRLVVPVAVPAAAAGEEIGPKHGVPIARELQRLRRKMDLQREEKLRCEKYLLCSGQGHSTEECAHRGRDKEANKPRCEKVRGTDRAEIEEPSRLHDDYCRSNRESTQICIDHQATGYLGKGLSLGTVISAPAMAPHFQAHNSARSAFVVRSQTRGSLPSTPARPAFVCTRCGRSI